MGSCRSTCQNQNQQILSDSMHQKELINQEGQKQPFKPPIIMNFQQNQKIEHFDFPIKQYQGKAHPILQITQKEGEEFDFFDENCTTNQCKIFEERLKLQQDCNSRYSHTSNSSLSNSRQLMSEYSNYSLPQKKKSKKKHSNQEGNAQVQKQKNRDKKGNSIFFQRHQKEFSLLIQQKLVTSYNNNFGASSSIKPILKKPSNRKVRSQSPIQIHVSFSK